MSATGSSNPIVLSGDFIEIAKVTDAGSGSETVEVVAGTMGDLSFEKENESVEAQLHEQALTVRNRTHYTLDTNFTATITPNIPQLETVGIVDQNGDPTGGAKWETVRYNVYENEPDDTTPPDAVLETYSVEWDFSELTLSVGDPGELNFTGFVNGGWHVGSTSTTTTT